MQLEKKPLTLRKFGSAEHVLVGERVRVVGREGKAGLKTTAIVETSDDFNTYLDRAKQRVEYAKTKKEGDLLATITFKKLMEDSEAIDLVKRHNGMLGLAKLVDSTGEHTLFAPLPIDRTFVKSVENTIRKAKDNPNFTLEVGVAAVYSKLPAAALEEVQSEENVFLVDVGPVDIAAEYEKFYETVKIGPTLDVYHKQLRFK